jgi:hypothetical protein
MRSRQGRGVAGLSVAVAIVTALLLTGLAGRIPAASLGLGTPMVNGFWGLVCGNADPPMTPDDGRGDPACHACCLTQVPGLLPVTIRFRTPTAPAIATPASFVVAEAHATYRSTASARGPPGLV